jgi:hypothetical protein
MKKIFSTLTSKLLQLLRWLFAEERITVAVVLSVIIWLICFGRADVYASELTFHVPIPEQYNWTINRPNLDKIAYCVAYHETKNFTIGYGKTHKNGYGIMTWENGYREPKRYNTQEESTNDFKRIWSKYYGGRVPTYKDAVKWSGNDRPEAWYYNFNWCYNNN